MSDGSGSVLIKVIEDRGAAVDATVSGNVQDTSGFTTAGGKNFIRRPTRGVQIRDNTFATIRLVAMVDGKNKDLIDAGSRRLADRPDQGIVDNKRMTDIYSNFLLQAVNEERAEKSQILETFGEPYIFLFGERPRMLTFSGILINTFDFNWEAEWWENYDKYIRGTAAVNADARVYIQYDQNLVGGYILGSSSSKTVNDPYHVGFTFQMFVTSYTNFSDVGNPDARRGYPLSGKGIRDSDSKHTHVFLSASLDAGMRPQLIDNSNDFSQQNYIKAFNDSTLSLIDSVQNEARAVTNAFSKVSSQLNTAFSGILGQFSLAPIHVPVGFAGASEFDTDNVRVDYITEQFYQDQGGYPLVVKYSVFSDNDDEYVGVSDHYGSSKMKLTNLGFERLEDRLSYGTKMTQKLEKAWQQSGYPITLDKYGTEARALVSGTLGLIVTKFAPIAIGVAQNAYSYVPQIASETPQPPMHLAVSPSTGKNITLTNPVVPPPPVGSAAPPIGTQIYAKVTLPPP